MCGSYDCIVCCVCLINLFAAIVSCTVLLLACAHAVLKWVIVLLAFMISYFVTALSGVHGSGWRWSVSRRGSWFMTQSLWLQVPLATNLFSPCTTLHIAIACTEDTYTHAQGNQVYVLCVYVLVFIALSFLCSWKDLISVVYQEVR